METNIRLIQSYDKINIKNSLDLNRKFQCCIMIQIDKISIIINNINQYRLNDSKYSSFSNKHIYLQNPYSLIFPTSLYRWEKYKERWTDKDTTRLRLGVKKYIAYKSELLKNRISNKKLSSLNSKNNPILLEKYFTQLPITDDSINRISNINNNLNINVDEIDFNYISEYYVKNHTPIQCKLFWINWASLSQDELSFSKEDDSNILHLAKKYDNHNWVKIAFELGDRNVLQTFIHFRIKFDLPSQLRFDGRPYKEYKFSSEFDDKRLIELVERFGVDSWNEISRSFNNVLPSLIKKRYENLLLNKITINWDDEKDHSLLQLYCRYNGNWDQIYKHINGSNSNDCKHRWHFLLNQRNILVLKNKNLNSLFKETKIEHDVYNEENAVINCVINDATQNDITQFKKLYNLLRLNLLRKVKVSGKKKNVDYDWNNVYRYHKECVDKILKLLNSEFININIKIYLIKLMFKIPRSDLYSLYSQISQYDTLYNPIYFGKSLPELNSIDLTLYQDPFIFIIEHVGFTFFNFDDFPHYENFKNTILTKSLVINCEVPQIQEPKITNDIERINALLDENKRILNMKTTLPKLRQYKRSRK